MYITPPKPLKPAGMSLCSFFCGASGDCPPSGRRPCCKPVLVSRTTPGLGTGRASLGPGPPPHRLLDRVCDFSRLPRFPRVPGGERRAWTLCLYGWDRCFWRPSSFWLWLFAGSLLPSFCSWSCSLWEGSVFLIVLIRNLLFVPARGHFILGAKREQPQIKCGLQSRTLPSGPVPKNLASLGSSFWICSAFLACHLV